MLQPGLCKSGCWEFAAASQSLNSNVSATLTLLTECCTSQAGRHTGTHLLLEALICNSTQVAAACCLLTYLKFLYICLQLLVMRTPERRLQANNAASIVWFRDLLEQLK